MLAIVEKHLQALNSARSDADIVRVLSDTAKAFGFRSAYLVEYGNQNALPQLVYDSDAKRRGWWRDYFASDLRPTPRDVATTLAGGPLLHLDASRFGPGSENLRAVCELQDVVDVVAVPISQLGELVGVAGFCGKQSLDSQHEMALQMIGYSLFAHVRTSRLVPNRVDAVALTPREREVMRLSAEGLTSAEIATRLGMSARTANQHADNVADKLGTRNRAHTAAEIVRRGLLD
jgi:LuxR family transcriptional regulator, quorum-sensing system regulator BjaR1